jgi:hypothetical protein
MEPLSEATILQDLEQPRQGWFFGPAQSYSQYLSLLSAREEVALAIERYICKTISDTGSEQRILRGVVVVNIYTVSPALF